jgi:hypothetical protein
MTVAPLATASPRGRCPEIRSLRGPSFGKPNLELSVGVVLAAHASLLLAGALVRRPAAIEPSEPSPGIAASS